LQSVNEELATVNAELQAKVTDLSRVNNDMNNLLAGTGIATVFVDHRLCILRFTPAASTIINLIPGDVGRPVGHIASNLVGYTTLVKDVQTVLDTLEPKQTEVRTVAGNSYTLRVKPYRTLENAIEGAVISFSDITEHIRMEETLRAEVAELLRLAVVARDVHDAIAVQDLDGRILTWSPGAVRMYGWTESEALQMNARDRIPDGGSEDPMTMQPHLSEGKGHQRGQDPGRFDPRHRFDERGWSAIRDRNDGTRDPRKTGIIAPHENTRRTHAPHRYRTAASRGSGRVIEQPGIADPRSHGSAVV
jgi:two-component system, chemotaxis family, CheB/CheR fusion protein